LPWNLPDTDDMTCIEVTGEYTDPWDRYQERYFNVITANCIYEYVRYQNLADGSVDINVNDTFKVTVWPDYEPPADGELVDLDSTEPLYLEIYSAAFFTVRTSEKDSHLNGFPWKAFTLAEFDSFECITMTNPNLGNYNTGYRPYEF
jgi:hypothetical protein